MADTADLRSEGKRSKTLTAKTRRKRYHGLKAQGLCVVCKAETLNRSYCYSCSKENSPRTYKSGTRKFLTLAGIDWENATSITKEQGLRLLDMVRARG